VLGYVIRGPKKGEEHVESKSIPPDLRRSLSPWIDVDEVGTEGFWLWLRAVLPLLPAPTEARAGSIALRPVPRPVPDRELHRRFLENARERARLAVICDQYLRDNQLLARRLRALEGALRAFESAGHRVELPRDDDAAGAATRYLPDRSRAGRSAGDRGR